MSGSDRQTPSPSVAPADSLPFGQQPSLTSCVRASKRLKSTATTPVLYASATSHGVSPALSGTLPGNHVRRVEPAGHTKIAPAFYTVSRKNQHPRCTKFVGICLYSPATQATSDVPEPEPPAITRKTVSLFAKETRGQLTNAHAPTALLGFLDSSFSHRDPPRVPESGDPVLERD